MNELPVVLVLGARGSVGRAICEAVDADAGLLAIAGVRAPTVGLPPRWPAERVRVADATDTTALLRALDGVTHVVNAVGGGPGNLRATTFALCAALQQNRRVRLVHLSSMAVYGGATGLVREDAPLFAQSAYAAAKIACEAELANHIASGRSAVILRPGIVYGPGSTQWTARIARLLAQRRLGDLGAAGDGWCNLIHERDLAAAVIAACRCGTASGLAFNVGTPTPPSWNDYLAAFARAVGAAPVRRITGRRLAIESRLAAPMLYAARRVAARTGLPPAPDPIPPSLLRLFAQRIRLDPARADAVLRFARTPDASGIAALAA